MRLQAWRGVISQGAPVAFPGASAGPPI